MRNQLLSIGIFLFLCVELAFQNNSLKRSIFVNLKDKTVRIGDEIILSGRFGNQIAQVRIISSSSSCRGGIPLDSSKPPQCQPLVLRMIPRRHQIRIFYKGAVFIYKDVELQSLSNSNITRNKDFRLMIKVGETDYTIYLNGEKLTSVDDHIGHESIIKLRSYGGYFSNFYLKNAAPELHMVDSNSSAVPCGTRPAFEKSGKLRIVGGTRARKGEFPWEATIRLKKHSRFVESRHHCGAALISSCWVVTAAHCTNRKYFNSSLYSIRVGDYYNRANDENYRVYEHQQEFDIAEVVNHPNFTIQGESPINDIALVKLKSNSTTCVQMSDLVRPICLPDKNDRFPTNSICTITGWGAKHWRDKHKDFPKILQKGNVRILDFKQCRLSYGFEDDNKTYMVADKTFCAAAAGVDSCSGDSGGPFVCKKKGTKEERFVLWGVTSWGSGCGDITNPGVYTKVIDFASWIAKVISKSQ